MKKNYQTPTIDEVVLETITSAMQVIASEQGIGYGGEDPGDGTVDPEARERRNDVWGSDSKFSLW